MTPVAVLVHGAGSCPATARLLLGPAVPDDVEAIAVEARGSIDQVVAAITAAAAGREVVLVAGISLGAHAAARWVASGGRCAALLLVMPAWTGAPGTVARVTATSADDIERRGRDAVLAGITASTAPGDWVLEELQRGWSTYDDHQLAAALRSAASSAGPTLDELAAIDVPTAVVALADDPLHPQVVARQWVRAIPGAHLVTVRRRAPGPDRGALGRAGRLALPPDVPGARTRAAPRLVVAYATSPAHLVLRTEAARFHQVPPAHIVVVHECPRCGSAAHGRPRLAPTASLRHPAHVSLARAGELSVVAVTDAGPVGVDVEAEGAADVAGLGDVVLHPGERTTSPPDLTRVWVRKEALLKAYGIGLAVDPGDLRLDDDGRVTWTSAQRPTARVWLRDLPVPGHVVTVAVLPQGGRHVERLEVTLRPGDGAPGA